MSAIFVPENDARVFDEESDPKILKKPRGLSFPTITLLNAVGNLQTTSPDQSTLDTSKTLPKVLTGDQMNVSHYNISVGPPAHSR